MVCVQGRWMLFVGEQHMSCQIDAGDLCLFK